MLRQIRNPRTSPPHLRPRRAIRSRTGAMLIMICVMIVAFIVTVVFTVDIAYMHLSKAELRSSTDAAAKAAAEALARTRDVRFAIDQGKAIALENKVAGAGLQLEDTDFAFGKSSPDRSGRFVFDPRNASVNSVQVTGRRTSRSLSGAVGLFFGRLLGRAQFEPVETATATFADRNIVLVIDRSGSMAGLKFRALQSAVGIFAATVQANVGEERIGLASYASDATENVQLTNNFAEINLAMQRLVPAGFTSISAGIAAGDRIMQRGSTNLFADQTLIVMTDGLHNTGRSPIVDAQLAADRGMTIHTITFGTDADQRTMKEVASIGGGVHIHAVDASALTEAFEVLANTLSTFLTD